MSALAALARALIRRLPEQEREAILRELTEQADDRSAVNPGKSVDHDRADPDWKHIWKALIASSSDVIRVERLLKDERTFFDFTEITSLAGQLRTLINNAYDLACTAPRLPGLHLEAGVDLDTARHLVDVRRAEIVDTELGQKQRPTTSGAPTWTIDYRSHGGFIATTAPGDGTTPSVVWGAAATALSASHLLSWYFHEQPPETVFSPPQPDTPWPLVTTVSDSALSMEAPHIAGLLDQRGPVYGQHIAACRSAHVQLISRTDVKGYLATRAAALNATELQLSDPEALDSTGSPENHDHFSYARAIQWVPTALVVATDHPTWGEFSGHRNETPYEIAAGLRRSNNLDDFTYELFTDEINLLRAPGWAGPLYRIGGNGNHRIHTARMLNLPWLAATVDVETIAPSWDMLGLLVEDPEREKDLHRPLEHRIQERATHIAGLIRRGIIDGDLTEVGSRSILTCRHLPAAWLLRSPHDTTRINAVYESLYPGALAQLGIPVAIGTHPVAWARWLTNP